jgi:hypothetical protein
MAVERGRLVEPDGRPPQDRLREVLMHPVTFYAETLWLIPPALAVSFLAWVLWSWWNEAHKH